MKNKEHICNALLLILIIFENLFLYIFFRNGLLSQGKNAIGLFLSSLLFGIVLIYKFYDGTASVAEVKHHSNKLLQYSVIILFSVRLVILGFQYNSFFQTHPIAFFNSDILPQIQIISKRFLAGAFPYSIINDFGFAQHVTYLPLFWLPFTTAEMLHIDYRWISFGVWCIAALWLCVRSSRIPSAALRIFIPVLLLASYYILFTQNNTIMEATVEVLIAGYYMMFITSLTLRNGILQGTIISICLLSRYSLVLWLPLYCFVLFVLQSRKRLYAAIGTILVLILVVYIIPFLSKDWTTLYSGYKYYDDGTLFEWTHLNKDHKPLQLFAGTGYAYYFYTRFANLEVIDRIRLLQKVHAISCVMITVILTTWFWFNRKRINDKIFLLSSFKIYLAIFLFLIQIPYEYLMCVGNFVSIAIFCEQARYRLIPKAATVST